MNREDTKRIVEEIQKKTGSSKKEAMKLLEELEDEIKKEIAKKRRQANVSITPNKRTIGVKRVGVAKIRLSRRHIPPATLKYWSNYTNLSPFDTKIFNVIIRSMPMLHPLSLASIAQLAKEYYRILNIKGTDDTGPRMPYGKLKNKE